MKVSKIILGLFILIIFASAIYAQQTFIQTVTRANKDCNAVCSVFEIPELDGKPHAIIFITPLSRNYLHPIGAYYMYLKKWSVFNLDGVAMSEGDTFKVEYFMEEDSNHFIYVVPNKNQPVKSFIDHVGLNNNPNAQVRFSPTNPPGGGALYNNFQAHISYDTTVGKWFITNDNLPVQAGSAFNIMFTQPTLSGTPMPVTPIETTLPPLTKASVAPESLPLQVIVRKEWAIPNQSTVLQSGQCRYVGSYVNTAILATDSVIVTGKSESLGNVLMWSGTVEQSSISIEVCNWRSMTQSASTTINLNGRKLNILVLR